MARLCVGREVKHASGPVRKLHLTGTSSLGARSSMSGRECDCEMCVPMIRRGQPSWASCERRGERKTRKRRRSGRDGKAGELLRINGFGGAALALIGRGPGTQTGVQRYSLHCIAPRHAYGPEEDM